MVAALILFKKEGKTDKRRLSKLDAVSGKLTLICWAATEWCPVSCLVALQFFVGVPETKIKIIKNRNLTLNS